ncbi:MAG: phosphonoacetaldehyde hydrolase [Candidatus Eremiobacteraeota bacterium]|nr:phosphonoacetaldehyde hydrolase [Candidatus Eremiobacteraeota bacterium]
MARRSGPIQAVIFDWAGTAVDFGAMAPVAAFAAAFEGSGVPVTIAEIRRPMGLEKRRHLAAMLADEAIAQRWRDVHGTAPGESDVDALYAASERQLAALLPLHAEPIPGLLDTLAALRAAGVKIGSNSGYSRRMMDVLAPAARERGFIADCIVAADEVAAGRPAPDLSLKSLDLLGLKHAAAIKVDDTRAGIEEGRNAGLWTVAVVISGNEVGLSLEQWLALDAGEQNRLRQAARERVETFGADFIVDTAAELGSVMRAIERRIDAARK